MAYTDDAVLAKLSALNETQESIVSMPCSLWHAPDSDGFQVTVAQWVMFHRYANCFCFTALCTVLIRHASPGDMQIVPASYGYNVLKTLEVIRG